MPLADARRPGLSLAVPDASARSHMDGLLGACLDTQRPMPCKASDTSNAWRSALASAAKHAPVSVQAAAAPACRTVRRGAVRGKRERGGEVRVCARVVPQALRESRGGLARGGGCWVCSARAGRQAVFGAVVTFNWVPCMMCSPMMNITV